MVWQYAQLINSESNRLGQGAQGMGNELGNGQFELGKFSTHGGFLQKAGKTFRSKSAQLVGSYLSSRQQKKQRKKLKRQIEHQRNVTRGIAGRGFAQEEAFRRQATEQRLAGFDAARMEAGRAGRSSVRAVNEGSQQRSAAVNQQLTNAGLDATTIGANATRGLETDRTRSIQRVNEGLASLYGNLALGRSEAEASGTESLADITSQRANFQMNDANFWLNQYLSQYGQAGGGSLLDA